MAAMKAAVVVPVHRQPQFMTGAALSALAQRPPVEPRVVIVNDGCPFRSTHERGTALERAHPDRVRYIRQENAGLSAARNAGIELALETWPDLEAVFPLDADNLLSTGTLGALWEQLAAAPDAAWATPAPERFGEAEGPWETEPPFTVYRQLFENQCDAGTLFRRAVFDRGLRYDLGSKAYADWLFVLEAALAGLRGLQAPPCGFRYRVRGGSMLASARSAPEEQLARIREKLPLAYRPAAVLRREHAEAPRFALVAPGAVVRTLAATDLEPVLDDPAEWMARVGATAGGTRRRSAFVAPITVLGPEPPADRLPGVLLRLQRGLVDAPAATAAGLRAVRTTDLHELPSLLELDDELAALCAGVRAALPPSADAPPARTLSVFAAHLHMKEWRTTFPHVGANDAAVWVVAGGNEPDVAAAVALARALGPVHLVVIGHRAASPATTVTELAGDEVDALLPVLLAGADTVLFAGAPRACLAAAPQAIRVAMATGRHDTALEDPSVDAYLAATEEDRLRLENLGAVPDKISVSGDWDDDPEPLRRAIATARERR
jgi:hypothetical protein